MIGVYSYWFFFLLRVRIKVRFGFRLRLVSGLGLGFRLASGLCPLHPASPPAVTGWSPGSPGGAASSPKGHTFGKLMTWMCIKKVAPAQKSLIYESRWTALYIQVASSVGAETGWTCWTAAASDVVPAELVTPAILSINSTGGTQARLPGEAAAQQGRRKRKKEELY